MNPSNPGQSEQNPQSTVAGVQLAPELAGQLSVSVPTMEELPVSLSTSNCQPTTSTGTLSAAAIPSSAKIATEHSDPQPRSPTVARTPEEEKSLFDRVYPQASHPLKDPQVLRDNIERAINMSYLTLEDNYDQEYVETHYSEQLIDRFLSASSKLFPIP